MTTFLELHKARLWVRWITLLNLLGIYVEKLKSRYLFPVLTQNNLLLIIQDEVFEVYQDKHNCKK